MSQKNFNLETGKEVTILVRFGGKTSGLHCACEDQDHFGQTTEQLMLSCFFVGL